MATSTEPKGVVEPIHSKAMPLTLRITDEIDLWMNAPAEQALQLQRPLPDNELIVLARLDAVEGQKSALF